MGRPLVNRPSLRRWNVNVRRSGETSQLVARLGYGPPSGAYRASPSNIAYMIGRAVVVVAIAGSRLSGSPELQNRRWPGRSWTSGTSPK